MHNRYISPDDLKLFYHARFVEDAATHIMAFCRASHSLRYVQNLTVLRLNQNIPPILLERLNDEYGDIFKKGKTETSFPLKTEIQRNKYLELPRLVLNFNKESFGRLNKIKS